MSEIAPGSETPKQKSSKPEKAGSLTNKILQGIIAGVIGLSTYYVGCGGPPLPPDYITLQPPIYDSAPIGKIYDNGSLRENGKTEFSVHRSWDSMTSITGFKSEAKLQNSATQALEIAFNAVAENVVKYDSLVVYEANDISSLNLPSSGQVVVTAAVVAKGFTLKKRKGIGTEVFIDSITKLAPDAKVSVRGEDAFIASGTGLVTNVKVIYVDEKISTSQIIYRQRTFNGYEYSWRFTDSMTKSDAYLGFIIDNDSRPGILGRKPDSVINVRFRVMQFSTLEKNIVYGKYDQSSGTNENSVFPKRIYSSSNDKEIYQYQLAADTIRLGPKSPNVISGILYADKYLYSHKSTR